MHTREGLICIVFSAAAFMGLRAERASDGQTLPLMGESEGADTSRIADLDEVVIVAQPKETGLLRTQPLSSTMFSATDLQSLKLGDVRQISLFVPTFTMPEYGSRYTSSAYIRGIGAKEGSSAIGMYRRASSVTTPTIPCVSAGACVVISTAPASSPSNMIGTFMASSSQIEKSTHTNV